jgi:hypothetical protein
MTSAEALSNQPSHDERVPVSGLASAPRQENVAKSLLSRGSRILRRQGSKFNIGATLDEEDEVGKVTQKLEVVDFFHRKARQNDARESPEKSSSKDVKTRFTY